jgi:hypothetical protein
MTQVEGGPVSREMFPRLCLVIARLCCAGKPKCAGNIPWLNQGVPEARFWDTDVH